MTKYYKSQIFKNTVAAGAMALAIAGTAGAAHAETRVTIKSNGFATIPITVISEDGVTWTKVQSDSLMLPVTIGLGKTDEKVRSFRMRQQWAGQESDVPWLVIRQLNYPLPDTVDEDWLIRGSTDNFTPAERTKILKACNASLLSGGSVGEGHSFFHGAEVQILGGFTDTTKGSNQGALGGKYATGTSTVTVNCKPSLQAGAADDVAVQEPTNLKVSSIELFRTTYANAVSQSTKGTVCKKAKLLVRLKTNKEGPVQFKLWKKIGDEPMTSEVHEAWSTFSGTDGFQVEYTEWVEVNKPSFVQAKAEEMVSAFGESTDWKSITLHCESVGGGGYADAPNPDDGPATTPLQVTGELTLADKANAPKDKPRLGAAVLVLKTNKPGNTDYKLTCSGGREWTGTLPTYESGGGTFQAVGQANFQIDKTEQIACALRSTSLANNAVVALATKQFMLIKRNPSVGNGPNDLQDAPRPSQASKPDDLKKQRAEQIAKRKEAAKKAAERKRRAAAQKTAAERKRRAVAKKAAAERKRRVAAKKAAAERKRRAAAKRGVAERKRRAAAKRAAAERKRRAGARRIPARRKGQAGSTRKRRIGSTR